MIFGIPPWHLAPFNYMKYLSLFQGQDLDRARILRVVDDRLGTSPRLGPGFRGDDE